MKKLFKPLSFIALITLIYLLIIWKNAPLFKSKYNYEFKEELISESYIRDDVSRMSDEYLPKEFVLPLKIAEIANDSIHAVKKSENKILMHTADEMIAMVQNKADDNRINFPITYFPGWKLYANSKEIKITPSTKFHLIAGTFAQGDYLVKLEFTDTPVRTAGNIVGLLSLSLLITWAFIKNKKYESR